MPHIRVEGIVAASNREPFVILTMDGVRAQLNIAEALKVAHDLQRLAANTEADAMLINYFKDHELPETALAALLHDFRDFRLRQENKPTDGTIENPDDPEKLQ
jgi:hypothetical protein